MSVTYRWDNEEKSIMLFSFEEPWTWDEYYNMKPISDKIIAEVGHPVAAIIEIPQNLHLGSNALGHSRTIDRTKPDNLWVMVIVTQSTLVRAFLGLADRLSSQFRDGFVQATSLEQARQIIAEKQTKGVISESPVPVDPTQKSNPH